jgi:hypothetical protein
MLKGQGQPVWVRQAAPAQSRGPRSGVLCLLLICMTFDQCVNLMNYFFRRFVE